jgi:hypothetical protein
MTEEEEELGEGQGNSWRQESTGADLWRPNAPKWRKTNFN